MAQVKDIIRIKCQSCGKVISADLMDCGCIFAHCEHCGCDTEDTKECAN